MNLSYSKILFENRMLVAFCLFFILCLGTAFATGDGDNGLAGFWDKLSNLVSDPAIKRSVFLFLIVMGLILGIKGGAILIMFTFIAIGFAFLYAPEIAKAMSGGVLL